MRKIALVKEDHPEVKRLMINDGGDDVYVFSYDSLKDSFCLYDDCYESVKDAEAACYQEYGVNPQDWEYIADSLPYCQADWINPVRIKEWNHGQPEWGKFERLVDGGWQEFYPETDSLE